MRQTHTYVILRLEAAAYQEIKSKLEAAGYHHVFERDPDDSERIVIDMHGIAIGLEDK